MKNIILLYKKIKSVRGVSSVTGISRDAISRQLAEKGIIDFLKIDEVQIDEIISLYNNNNPIKAISKLLNIAQKSITYVLISKSLIKPRTSKFPKDENFFETIDSEIKAYWLGYLYADGYVHAKTTNIELACKDKEHLEKFRNSICKTAKIKKKIVILNGKSYLNYRITISSVKLVNDLKKCGCYQNKSLTLKPPMAVPSNLVHHFIRGYFDGDGSTGIYKLASGLTCYNIKICGTKEFLSYIGNTICEELNLKPVKLYRKKGNKAYDYNRSGRLNYIKIRNYLYKDSTVYLDRKRTIMFSV